jgi:SAM-dependent methyltransferase
VTDPLRLARSALFRIAQPFDSLTNPAVRKGALPPLTLRRHTGPVRYFESSAREFDAWIEKLELLREDDRVLDIGCGPGSMALRFSRRSWHGCYLGFDVHEPSIDWCRQRFAADPRFSFVLARMASPYGEARGTAVSDYRFPAHDGQMQLVLAKSVFTHLLEREARHYLAEIGRVLEPGRAALVTAFLFEPGSRTGRGLSRYFPIVGADAALRFRRRSRPEAAVAYEVSRFRGMVEAAGLRILWTCHGFFPGDDPRPKGQDILLLGR